MTTVKLRHSRLGDFTYNNDGYWEGEFSFADYRILVWIEGDETGIYPFLADDCSEVVEHFSTNLEKAFDLLNDTCEELGIHQEIEFVPTHLCQFWRRTDDRGFSVLFNDTNRADVLWSVEFVNSEAKYAGCDT